MASKRWVGVFGGSFDPPHLGHLMAAIYALKVHEFDEVWFVPAYHHAFGKRLSPFKRRADMCRRLIQEASPKLKVSEIEKSLRSDGRMLLTLQALRRKHPSSYFSLIIGSDLLRERRKWYKFSEIEERFMVFTVPRGKSPSEPFYVPDISSTDVRRRLRSRRSLANLLTPGVAEYVLSNRLYT